jgi:hypothetical protein
VRQLQRELAAIVLGQPVRRDRLDVEIASPRPEIA